MQKAKNYMVRRAEICNVLNAQRQTLSRLLAKRFPVEREESKTFAAYFAQISDSDQF